MGLDRPMGRDICDDTRGARNLITDVPGVTVGHVTLDEGDVHTGVTAICPAPGDIFHEKVVAACHVMNGFGKSAGLLQVAELGSIETPIVLASTLSVGITHDAVTRYMLEKHPRIGREEGTVNPVVLECNDGYLSDARALAVQKEHVFAAMENAAPDFSEGAAGAGRGMRCFDLKGGIGSASRRIEIGGRVSTLGALVMTNFGEIGNFTMFGENIGRQIAPMIEEKRPEQGSVIVVIATDLPLCARQLGRLCRRAEVGIIRTGGYIGNDSGEVALAFSTARRMPHSADAIFAGEIFPESQMNRLFRAVGSCVEESILSSMLHAETLVGRDGHTARGLREVWG